MLSSQNKRHGMLLYNSNGSLTSSTSTLSIDSRVQTSVITSSPSTNAPVPKRKPASLPSTTASLSLGALLRGDDDLLKGGSFFTVLSDSNSKNQEEANNDVQDVGKYREAVLNKLIKSNNSAGINYDESKENFHSSSSTTKDQITEPSKIKRKTPLLMRGSSNLSNLKESASIKSNNRLSTYSVASINSTISTRSTRSNGSSFKAVAQKIVNAVSGSTDPNFHRSSSGDDLITKRRFMHQRSSSNLSGGPAEPFSPQSSHSEHQKQSTPEASLHPERIPTPSLPDQQPEPAQQPLSDYDSMLVTEAQNITTTLTKVKENPAPQLKKKVSRFRLRHSISLRSLTGRADNDNESMISTATNNDTASKRRGGLSSIRRSIVSFGGNTNTSNVSIANNSSISGEHSLANVDKSHISLPVVQQSSRGKLANKLKNSSSLISISSFISNSTNADRSCVDNNEIYTIRAPEYDTIQQKLLLKLCNQQRVVSFSTFMNKLRSKERSLEKLAESTFSEIYLERKIKSQPICVWKIIPFGNENCNQQLLSELIQELSITMAMSSVKGYIKIKSSTVVKGPFPPELIDLWDSYNENNRGSKNERPDYFSKNQLHLVMRLEYGGEDLEHFQIRNWSQAYSIFWQIAESLQKGEELYEFEHRDLHWGNILIENKNSSNSNEELLTDVVTNDSKEELKVTIIDFTLSRAKLADKVIFTGLDAPSFFKGKDDYQFEIYKLMRQLVTSTQSNQSTTLRQKSNASSMKKSDSTMSINSLTSFSPSMTGNCIDWSASSPKFNILWLHYILDRLLKHKGLKPIRMNPIARSSSSATNASAGLFGNSMVGNELSKEVESYEKLSHLYKVLDPSKKRKRFNKEFSGVGDLLTWSKNSKLY